MAKRSFSLFALGLGALALGTALLIVAEWRHSQPAPRPAAPRPEVLTGAGPFFPLPSAMPLDARKVELGRNLFQDRRLSGDGSVSCASCHDLARGGVDRLAHSRGIGGREGAMNAPTVFNSGFNFRQFWDGRARTLEEQVDGPLHSDVEMGSNWPLVLQRLGADPAMVTAFGTLYPNGLQPANVRDALATFERSLVTPNSRFDRFLRGDSQALAVASTMSWLACCPAGTVVTKKRVSKRLVCTEGTSGVIQRVQGSMEATSRHRSNCCSMSLKCSPARTRALAASADATAPVRSSASSTPDSSNTSRTAATWNAAASAADSSASFRR